MDIKNNQDLFPYEDLTALIEMLPEETAPEDLVLNVMGNIKKTGPSFFSRIVSLFRHQVTFSFSPAKVFVALACLVVAIIVLSDNFPNKDRLKFDQISTAKQSSFDLGKQLLSIGAFEASVKYLEQAVKEDSSNAEYYYWLGVNLGNLKRYEDERNAYFKVVSLKPGHLMSRFYLGHSYMNEQRWKEALDAYDTVRQMYPDFERVLYNKGLALKNLENTNAAVKTWKAYLEKKKTGIWALKTVARLNAEGNYEYRAVLMGKKTLIVGPLNLNAQGKTTWISLSDIQQLGRSLAENPELDLFIIVNHSGHSNEAKNQALSIKKMIVTNFPDISPARIKPSWFGEKEIIKHGHRSMSLEQSVRFLGIEQEKINKGVQI